MEPSIFQSTPPGWEATQTAGTISITTQHFNPRLPGGRRHNPLPKCDGCCKFQSTPPGWEATCALDTAAVRGRHFNPRLPGGRRRKPTVADFVKFDISIHASRVGGDGLPARRDRQHDISIHASRVGGDDFRSERTRHCRYFNPRLPGGRRLIAFQAPSQSPVFQSTPPGWEATEC